MAKEMVNGHELYSFNTGDGGIYIDHNLAVSYDPNNQLRIDKDVNFWRKFLKENPDFDAQCLLPRGAPFYTKLTFEDIYENKERS